MLARTLADGEHDYGHTLSKVIAAMNTRRSHYSGAEPIVEFVFTAATDDTDQVMYLVGPDAEQSFTLRQSLSEAERLDMVQQYSDL